jgi:murein DD-endopeptidase MepM/ murein hydrolase activator NlpD/urea transporter
MNFKAILNNFWVESTLNSYSIILFSNNKLLAFILMFVTFMTPQIGLVGLGFILFFHLLLVRLGYNKLEIRSGVLGFNAVLVGLSIAYSYEINKFFIGLFFIAILIAVVITIWCKNYFGKYHLPFLTIPFFIIINIISMSTKSFDVFNVNMDFVFHENTLVFLNQNNWYRMVHSLDLITIPNHFKVFLITLSTIFYQKSVLGGLLILFGMFIFSRIAVLYAFIGFYSALFFYHIMGGNLENLTYFYSGVNFIFLAIALGCYFYIPNIYSILLVFFLSPILMFIMITLGKIMFVFQMNSMSMSFSILTSITLYILYSRHDYKLIIPANTSYNSPEKALYDYLHHLKRKVVNPYYTMFLPFWGEWFVSQGYDGKITHLGDWGKALDFVICDEKQDTYNNYGQKLADFYCYNKPILAPADGYVYDAINYVEENEINEVNVLQNWGNSIIINHLNGLYSQISHIKKDSFLVNIGDYVKKGTIIATCGNSGRSPEPHIHFQAQHIPTFGAKTVPLPLSYFIENKDNLLSLKINEIPEENTIISNVEPLDILHNAFNFKPNNRLLITNEKTKTIEKFEIFTNEWNQLYFYCEKTETKLFFKNDGVLFTFENYVGSKKSGLFDFYKSCYALLLGYYPTITLEYFMPNYLFTHFGMQYINDILAPIYNLIDINFSSKVIKIDNQISPSKITMSSNYKTSLLGKSFFEKKSTLTIFENSIIEIENQKTKNKYLIACEAY